MNPQVTPKSTPVGWWFVRSSSNPATFYRIGTDRHGLFTCECADHVNRHRDCKHIRTVQQGGGIAAQPLRRTLPKGKNWTAVRPVPAAPKPQPSPAVRDLADSLAV
jgi:hypothetical protein